MAPRLCAPSPNGWDRCYRPCLSHAGNSGDNRRTTRSCVQSNGSQVVVSSEKCRGSWREVRRSMLFSVPQLVLASRQCLQGCANILPERFHHRSSARHSSRSSLRRANTHFCRLLASAMPLRKPHTKSRNGCLPCKKRHIKV